MDTTARSPLRRARALSLAEAQLAQEDIRHLQSDAFLPDLWVLFFRVRAEPGCPFPDSTAHSHPSGDLGTTRYQQSTDSSSGAIVLRHANRADRVAKLFG